MTIELLEFVSDGERTDHAAELVEVLGHREIANPTPLRVAGEGVVSPALDVQRRQVQGDLVGGAEQFLR